MQFTPIATTFSKPSTNFMASESYSPLTKVLLELHENAIQHFIFIYFMIGIKAFVSFKLGIVSKAIISQLEDWKASNLYSWKSLMFFTEISW
jgi:hypothetical protein